MSTSPFYKENFEVEKDVKFHIMKFLLYPKNWQEKSNEIKICLNWRNYKFNTSNKERIPDNSGVYAFIVKPDYPNFFETRYLFYVGKTERTLKIRYGEYLKYQSGKLKSKPAITKMLNIYKDQLYFYFSEVNDDIDKTIEDCENKIINTFLPYYNSVYPIAKISPVLKDIYK